MKSFKYIYCIQQNCSTQQEQHWLGRKWNCFVLQRSWHNRTHKAAHLVCKMTNWSNVLTTLILLMAMSNKKTVKLSYLPKWVVSAWNLRVGVDVLQVPWEGFTLQWFSQSLPWRNIAIINPNHTWRNTHNQHP